MATVACCQWPEDCAAMISLQSVNCLGDETDRAERVQGPGSARIYGSWTLIPDSLEHKARLRQKYGCVTILTASS